MHKIVGSLLILMGGFFARWLQLREYIRCMETLDTLIFALRQMESEIRVNLLPLPELLTHFERLEQKEVQTFFDNVHSKLKIGKSPAQVIPQLAEKLPIPKRCQEILSTLGKSLRGDESCMTKAIHRAVDSLEEERKQLAGNHKQEQQRLSVCTMSAAVLLIILLI